MAIIFRQLPCRHLGLLAVTIGAISCTHAPPASTARDDRSPLSPRDWYLSIAHEGQVPDFVCDKGESYVAYALDGGSSQAEPPPFEELGLPEMFFEPRSGLFVPPQNIVSFANKSSNIRFDFCLDQQENIRLGGILFRTPSTNYDGQRCEIRCLPIRRLYLFLTGSETRLIPAPSEPDDYPYPLLKVFEISTEAVQGIDFDSVLFGQEPLRLTFSFTDDRRLVVEPSRFENHVLARIDAKIEDHWRPYDGTLILGQGAVGSPFSTCPQGFRDNRRIYIADNFRAEFEGCVRSQLAGNGPAWNQIYHKLTLQTPDGTQHFSEEGLANVFTYHSDQHHHFDDFYHIELTDLEIGFGYILPQFSGDPVRLEGVNELPQGFTDGHVWAMRRKIDGAWTAWSFSELSIQRAQ